MRDGVVVGIVRVALATQLALEKINVCIVDYCCNTFVFSVLASQYKRVFTSVGGGGGTSVNTRTALSFQHHLQQHAGGILKHVRRLDILVGAHQSAVRVRFGETFTASGGGFDVTT